MRIRDCHALKCLVNKTPHQAKHIFFGKVKLRWSFEEETIKKKKKACWGHHSNMQGHGICMGFTAMIVLPMNVFCFGVYSWKITSKLCFSHGYKPGLLRDLTRGLDEKLGESTRGLIDCLGFIGVFFFQTKNIVFELFFFVEKTWNDVISDKKINCFY